MGSHKCIIGFNDLKSQRPDIFKQIHHNKNTHIDTNTLAVCSGRKIYWLCSKCEHEWLTSPRSRTGNNSGCPKCAGQIVTIGKNDLRSLRPDIYQQIDFNHPNNHNIKFHELMVGSDIKLYWLCNQCNHSWITNIEKRTRKNNPTGCPKCAKTKIWYTRNKNGHGVIVGKNDLESQRLDLLEIWDYELNQKKPSEIFVKSNRKYWWKCLNGHSSYLGSCANISKGNRCPICKSSKGEVKLEKLFNQYNIKYIRQYSFKELITNTSRKTRLRFDFYLPKYDLLIEYQGRQHYKYNSHPKWDGNKTRISDQLKRDYCKKNKMKLLAIPYTYFDKLEDIVLKIMNKKTLRLRKPKYEN